MYIKCLVENTNGGLSPKHGLSLYIETKNHKILFDLGPSDLFYKNAQKANIDISQIDTVIISHGHFDHGGGLETFLKHNTKAKIYIQSSAFKKHYTKALFLYLNIGLDEKYAKHKQIELVDGDYVIDDELSLYVAHGNFMPSEINNSLLDENKNKDAFYHEHSLLIKEDKNVLFTGCSHNGVFNILNSINENIDILIGGFHLFNPVSGKTVSDDYLEEFKNELRKYNIDFYTCHCTGLKAYKYLESEKVKYISCGMEMNTNKNS